MPEMKEVETVGYRKVSYLEQCWYILCYQFKKWRCKHNAKKS